MAWGWSRGPTQAGDELGSGEAKGRGAGHHPWDVVQGQAAGAGAGLGFGPARFARSGHFS